VNRALLPPQKRRRKSDGVGLTALDPQVKQLAEGREMPVKELLKELPAMIADDRAEEVGGRGEEKEEEEGGAAAARADAENTDRFLKAGIVDSYIAAVLQPYKVQQALGHNTLRHPRGGVLKDIVK
jgi:hypothetical protein